MTAPYTLADPSAVPSPALLFYPALIRQNLRRAVEIAGGPDRLRPHVKTHKTREIVRLWLDLGVGKHKCATLAEAEMLAECGAPDVLIAYPLVGPNAERLAGLAERFPKTRFSTLADDPTPSERCPPRSRHASSGSTCCSTSTSASTGPASPWAEGGRALRTRCRTARARPRRVSRL